MLDAQAEAIDVESEKASEKGEDEDDLESTLEDKKAESNVEDDDEEEREEEEEEKEGSVDDGDRSQSGEPLGSFKELLIEKPDLTGSESVPASPSSQVSLRFVISGTIICDWLYQTITSSYCVKNAWQFLQQQQYNINSVYIR